MSEQSTSDEIDGIVERRELAAPRVTRRELEVLNLVADGNHLGKSAQASTWTSERR
jgi:DNA-binding CsgD family transcriptional regulator